MSLSCNCMKHQGRRGHWAVYYTSPQQSFIITFSYLLALKLWGLRFSFHWYASLSLMIVIYRIENFVHYHYWGCTSIYRPLSYFYRSLIKHVKFVRSIFE